jgi:hypothetical protein
MSCVIIFHEKGHGIVWFSKSQSPGKIKYMLGMYADGEPTPSKGATSFEEQMAFWKKVKHLNPNGMWLSQPAGAHESIMLELWLNDSISTVSSDTITHIVKSAIATQKTKPGSWKGIGFGLLEHGDCGLDAVDPVLKLL